MRRVHSFRSAASPLIHSLTDTEAEGDITFLFDLPDTYIAKLS